ncbi:DNA topoisomerase [Macleaya cordata]|uniref:DNA topoisomerase n=1 Tax=Macleaya cordata TaxID=56857 RepID=A0A200R2I0_MACCD|nr:DNA topoisomerase [Macleaya cordata]
MAHPLHNIRRLFLVSGCSYRNISTPSRLPIMSQCRTLRNYPGTFSLSSPFGGGCKYRKCSQLKLRKSMASCRVTEGQLKDLILRRDSCLFRTFTEGYNQGFGVTLQTQLGVGFPYTMKHITNKNSESIFRLSSSFNKCVSRRFSTVKAIQKSQVPSELMNIVDNVAVTKGKRGNTSSSFKLFHGLKKKEKSITVCSSSIDGATQVAVSSQPVKKSLRKATKSVSKTVNSSSPKELVGGDGKKDVKLGSIKKSSSNARKVAKTVNASNPEDQVIEGEKVVKSRSSASTAAKSSSNNQEKKVRGKTKQQLGNREHEKQLFLDSIPSGADKAKGSKKASQAKKVNDSNPGISSQTLESLPVEEKPLVAVNDSSLTHHQKKTTENSTTKRKPRETKVLTKSDKALAKSYSSVLVKLNQNRPGTTIEPLYPPTGKSVVVVESLTKAKVIQGYLGDMFEVLPSYGHVRDLAGRSGSVRPDDDFSVVWEVPSAAWTHLKSIKVALKGANNLILASDPDREGEAIAWHITEMLQQQEAIHEKMTVARVVFHEITESSIKSALQAPRDINANLVHAYLARRVLDYLIGFNISPLLWRKLPGCQSAGRVQSAALALICDREKEIDEFKPQEYWTIEVEFNKMELGKAFYFPSHLTHFGFKKLEQLSINSQAGAKEIEQKITTSSFEVVSSRRSKTRKNPPAPYITSTLQQDAANKLHFTASYIMKLAQKLYEGVKLSKDESTGLITYMRTDGMHVSDEAAKDIRSLVIERYGNDFASENTRKYFKKVKNAQEAHEAIRPTNIRRFPSMLAGVLDEDSLKLYTLIWSRTMACQMEPIIIDQVQVDIGGAGQSLVLRSTCSRVEFLGYQAVYKDGEAAAIGNKEKEGNANEEAFNLLSTLKPGDSLYLGKVELKQHHTQPPSRYSEGSLVKKLEELGIGRPSTYASTIKVLQDRSYLTVKSRVLHPEFRGRMVSAFLSHHFSEVTDYSFTADMENELDNVSAGTTEWKGLLKDYWERFSLYCDNAGSVDIRQVEKMLEETFGDFLFASLPDKSRTCPSCMTGTLIFKVSKFGAGYFIGCDQHPKCKYIAKTMYGEDEEGVTQKMNIHTEPKLLGLSPGSNEKVLLKNGPYGLYVQLGEDRKGHPPKRASVSKIKDVESITLDQALELLHYPVTLGKHPEDGQPVDLRLARFGFTIKHRSTYASVPKNMNPEDVTLEEALKLLSSKGARQSGRPKRKPKKLEEAL